MIPAFLLAPAAKWGGIGLAIAACFGFGFKKGLDWRADQLHAARTELEQAEQRAESSEGAAKQAQHDYARLRQDVAQAMEAARDQAAEQEKHYAQAAQKAKQDADTRVAGVLDHTRRMLAAVAPPGGMGPARPVPEARCARQLDDPAVERALIGRVGECAQAEERLRALQALVRPPT